MTTETTPEPSTFTKVKNHFHEKKGYYVTGVIALGVGVGATAIVLQTGNHQAVKIQQLLSWKSTITAPIVQQSIPRAGHAGKVLMDRETGEVFMSMNKLAKHLDVSRRAVQRYLEGGIPDLAGRQFSLIADGASDLNVTQTISV